ncbi:hypothetical protein W02_20520 [Nitrospira sp. KM1]|uniref:VPLPA-CTERM sorting domain-containing protein n=1 Tax=Nitrospira sp. KM1 TaxID=1936990 RepID=UPI0013A75B91|nr:VPLPA-CTERM sorting domain-containing protein [Nitrospira sp. KM1]BCA54912.1 hypothetical protein W02_20520 [Nitrospira sp. KM1]
MQDSKALKSVGRAAAAAVMGAALMVTGLGSEAQAEQFGPGDLVLVVYGNNTELVQKVGTIGGIASGISTTIDLSQVGGANALQYTLLGFNQTPPSAPSNFLAGSSIAAETFTTGQKVAITPTNYVNPLVSWGTQLVTANDTRLNIPKADALSFSTFLNQSGNNSLNGGFPVRMSSDVDTLLNIIGRNNAPQGNVALANLGTALLTAAGQFTISAVPIPAAAVLFATGMIGLVGVARRSFNMTA